MATRIFPTDEEIQSQINDLLDRAEKEIKTYEEIERELAALDVIESHRPLTDKELDQQNDLLETLVEMDEEG